MAKQKRRPEQLGSKYSGIPWEVQDSTAYKGASGTATKMLFEIIRIHNGQNNGHLAVSESWLRTRGWNSSDVIHRAKNELVERNLIVKTRQGGFNMGPDWWAVTWLSISDFTGIAEFNQTTFPRGSWHWFKPPESERPKKNCNRYSVIRSSATPSSGAVEGSTTPSSGAIEALLDPSTTPSSGDKAVDQLPHDLSPDLGNRKTWILDDLQRMRQKGLGDLQCYMPPEAFHD